MARKRRKIKHQKNYNWTYTQKLGNFDYKSFDNELIEMFERKVQERYITFFDVIKQFTLKIHISDVDLRSALYGKDGNLLDKLANTFNMMSNNNSKFKDAHQMKIFDAMITVGKPTTWRNLMKLVEDYLRLLEEELYTWNIVYYGYYREGVVSK